MSSVAAVYEPVQALQALLISVDAQDRRQILSGARAISIRLGFRQYQRGLVMLCCPLEPWCVQAEITDVRLCLLRDVPEDEIAAEGCKTRDDLIARLRMFYPKVTDLSPVTVIRWANLSGALTKEPVSQGTQNDSSVVSSGTED